MNKIKILTDSAGDLSLDVAKEKNITVLPIKLTLDGENYINDKYDIKEEEFYKKLRETDAFPKTTQITPAFFEESFKNALEDADELIYIGLSAKASGTFNNANLAKQIVEEETGKKIHLVDGRMFSYGYGDAALRASEMADSGMTSEEIIEKLDEILENTVTYFGVETLDYLKKGGRLSTLSAIIGGMLDIRPVLKIYDGLVGAVDKVKGEKKLFLKMEEYLKAETEGVDDYRVTFLTTDRFDKIEKLKEIAERNNIKVYRTGLVGAVIGCHAGPGAFGMIIAKK